MWNSYKDVVCGWNESVILESFMEKINVELSSMGRIRLEVVEIIIDGCNLGIQWFQE